MLFTETFLTLEQQTDASPNKVPDSRVISQATWSETPPPFQNMHLTQLQPPLSPSAGYTRNCCRPSKGAGRLSPTAHQLAIHPMATKLLQWGAKLQQALPEPASHMSQQPTLRILQHQKGFPSPNGPLPTGHNDMARMVGVRQVHAMQPLCPACTAFPRTLPLPPAGEVAFFFALSYPKCFLKAPGNASKRFYSLSV